MQGFRREYPSDNGALPKGLPGGTPPGNSPLLADIQQIKTATGERHGYLRKLFQKLTCSILRSEWLTNFPL
jgi:hypothetical protein